MRQQRQLRILDPVSGCRLMHHTVSAVLKAFVSEEAPKASAEPDTAVATAHRDALAAAHREAMARLDGSCELQHHVLRYVAGLLAAAPASLKFLRWAGLWELLYGEFFFQQGLPRQEPASGRLTTIFKLLYGTYELWEGLQAQQWAGAEQQPCHCLPCVLPPVACCRWQIQLELR